MKPMVRQVGLTAVLLALFAFFGIGLVAVTQQITAERIAANEREALLRSLEEVLPREMYDNELLADARQIPADARLGTTSPSTLYLARRQGEPVAVILSPIARDGYSGDIHLLVGIDVSGKITGVRVTKHRETPGLGDPIEAEKSDWILGFSAKSLGDPEAEKWAVQRDGGVFDQFTGATITPRAVVQAVKKALLYFEDERDSLLQESEA